VQLVGSFVLITKQSQLWCIQWLLTCLSWYEEQSSSDEQVNSRVSEDMRRKFKLLALSSDVYDVLPPHDAIRKTEISKRTANNVTLFNKRMSWLGEFYTLTDKKQLM
jgi:hypothetical protein